MEAKHTPGPWNFSEGDADRQSASTVFKGNDKDFTIALVNCEWSNKDQRAEDIANARLIAAAPELLAALRVICDYCNVKQAKPGHSYNIPADGLLLANARAALAKANA